MMPEHLDNNTVSLGSELPLDFLLNDDIMQAAGIQEYGHIDRANTPSL